MGLRLMFSKLLLSQGAGLKCEEYMYISFRRALSMLQIILCTASYFKLQGERMLHVFVGMVLNV